MLDQLKTIGFAAVVCIVCSLLLAAVYSGLKDEQAMNRENELRIKVLQAFGVEVFDEKGRQQMSNEDIIDFFEQRIRGRVLSGEAQISDISVAALSEEQINDRDPETGLKEYYPFFVYDDERTGRKKYAIHVSGMGLWSVVKGYIALEDDLTTIAGIAFYDHGETPGLGGEIEKDFFQDRFKGKKMASGADESYFRIIKPGRDAGPNGINGISGATMTCRGVEAFINKDFEVYNRYFKEKKSGEM